MAIPGKEIHRCKDKLGPIYVYEDELRRYLAFDAKLKQSCVHKQRPHELLYEYTKAMALALAFTPVVKRCFIGGLGGGSLAHFLLKYYPEVNVTALEYRAQVVKLAREYFYLPRSSHLDIHETDLKSYLGSKSADSFDVMMLDLYTADGMHEQQKNVKLYKRCFKRLSPQGVLVINLPSKNLVGSREILKELEHISGQSCFQVTFTGGNLMAYAFKGEKRVLNTGALNNRVGELSSRTGINFGKIAEQLK